MPTVRTLINNRLCSKIDLLAAHIRLQTSQNFKQNVRKWTVQYQTGYVKLAFAPAQEYEISERSV